MVERTREENYKPSLTRRISRPPHRIDEEKAMGTIRRIYCLLLLHCEQESFQIHRNAKEMED